MEKKRFVKELEAKLQSEKLAAQLELEKLQLERAKVERENVETRAEVSRQHRVKLIKRTWLR